MPYERLTLHGYVVSRTERLPTKEDEPALVSTDIVVDGHSQQIMTTVPLRVAGPIGAQQDYVEAEVPYGPGSGCSRIGNDSRRISIGIESPQPTSHTLVSIQTSDLRLLELLRAGYEVEVRIKANDGGPEQEPKEGSYRRWEVVQPE